MPQISPDLYVLDNIKHYYGLKIYSKTENPFLKEESFQIIRKYVLHSHHSKQFKTLHDKS